MLTETLYWSRERGWNGKNPELRKSPQVQKRVQRFWQRRGRSWRRSWGLQASRYVCEFTWATLTHNIRCTNPDCFVASCAQLSASVTEITVPFDATSETPLEEQRTEAMVRVRDAMLARLGPEAMGLLRAARSIRLSASDWWEVICFF